MLKGLNKPAQVTESAPKKKRRKKKGTTPKVNDAVNEEKIVPQDTPASEEPSDRQQIPETVRSTIVPPSRPRVTGLRKRYPGALLSSKKPGGQ